MIRCWISRTVNSEAAGQQLRPAVAASPDGFVIVWEDDKDKNGVYQVLARGFYTSSRERFHDITVNSDFHGQQLVPDVAMDGFGNFVVVWEDDADENGVYQVRARGFRPNGSEKFTELTVNRDAPGHQLKPAVAAVVDGAFVVTWEDDRNRNGFYEIVARGFAPRGQLP